MHTKQTQMKKETKLKPCSVKIKNLASKKDPDFFFRNVLIATLCEVNTEMMFCGKLNTDS